MLDVDGDGLISLDEMLSCIKEAYAARESSLVVRIPWLLFNSSYCYMYNRVVHFSWLRLCRLGVCCIYQVRVSTRTVDLAGCTPCVARRRPGSPHTNHYYQLPVTCCLLASPGTAAKVGRNIEVNDALDRIRDVMRENKQVRGRCLHWQVDCIPQRAAQIHGPGLRHTFHTKACSHDLNHDNTGT